MSPMEASQVPRRPRLKNGYTRAERLTHSATTQQTPAGVMSRNCCAGWSILSYTKCVRVTAIDRIRAGIDVCWLTSFKDIQANFVRNTVGFTKLLPGLYRQLDTPDVISLAAPRALLCINGLQDKLFPVDTGVRTAYKTLEAVYAKLNASGKFRGHIYDTPHEFNTEMQQEAWDWFRRWLS